MLDPIAYRRHLLARLLRLAGAGSAGAVALAGASCGARSHLGAASGATASASGAGGLGAGGSTSTSLVGGGGFGGSGVGGFGGGGFGGALVAAGSGGPGATGATVTVGVGGGAPTDGGVEMGMACINVPPQGCPSAADAPPSVNVAVGMVCEMLVAVVAGPILENGACCYDVVVKPFPCYVGRTFFVDEGIVKAELRRGRSWREGSSPDVSALPPATRRALGDAWARDGLFEHASVASFSRFSMQLLALGAPAELLRDTHAACIDEVRHAELCLALASAYLGEDVEPASLPMPAPITIEPDLAAVAAEVVMEGCIGETVATAQALDALAAATDPAVREALAITVADETRHAELAWRFVTWAIDEGGEPVREAVLEAFAGFRPPEPRVEALDDVDLVLYGAHGRQAAREGRAIAERAMADLIQPAMCALLSRRRLAA
jgi:hypothetical protein